MSLISAITARGHMRFMIKDKGGVNAAVFIEFLKRLMAGAKRAIFLIVDIAAPPTLPRGPEAFVDSQHGRLRLFFLPPYSPDRNPDELVWKHLKADTVGRMTITDKADFKAKVRASMRQLAKTDPKKSGPSTKNHRSNMPPESAFTYGLINKGREAREIGMYKIFCEVHGGERDYRSGYLKSDGKVAVFNTRKEAQVKADRLNASHNSKSAANCSILLHSGFRLLMAAHALARRGYNRFQEHDEPRFLRRTLHGLALRG